MLLKITSFQPLRQCYPYVTRNILLVPSQVTGTELRLRRSHAGPARQRLAASPAAGGSVQLRNRSGRCRNAGMRNDPLPTRIQACDGNLKPGHGRCWTRTQAQKRLDGPRAAWWQALSNASATGLRATLPVFAAPAVARRAAGSWHWLA